MPQRRQMLAAALTPLLMPGSSARAAPAGSAGLTAPAAAALPEPLGPYALPNTFVHPLPDPVSGRKYEVWVDLPPGPPPATAELRPAVFVTDAPYAFPMVRALRNRVGQQGRNLADFVLVGLGGPAEESAVEMRSRDYTPSNPLLRRSRPADRYGAPRYGDGAAYLNYLTNLVIPAVTTRYRLDPRRRVLLGHSYGALLAAQALFASPELFSHYILGSPSFWFDERVMFEREADYAKRHTDLPAQVFQYVGAYEAVAAGPRYNRQNDLVADARRFESALRKRRYPSLRIQSHVLTGEDHLTVAPVGATRGLLWALPGRGPYEG